MGKILVVDDDPQITRALRINLATRGYDVATAHDGATALRETAGGKPDLIVLDLCLPDTDGIDVITAIRGWSRTPILVLSARRDPHSKVAALDAGADDYVTKPFGMDELLARIRAATRRSAAVAALAQQALVDTGTFTVDLTAKRIWRDSVELHLTPTEWGVLDVLARNRGRLVSQRVLLDEVWGPGHRADGHYLRVYIGQLRRKLEPEPARPRHLITEPGMGYRLV
ncbi:Fis family transcriptional regulator [Kibdelosporangium phytohabitans]|uniref:Fis family transcriptional regulator n=1 Tax=Kibdelosporangium phytohabitans TaxID=860235 RepID=A0A0N7F5R3_9PSEU|nr:Fis family transcriptional regulator [Kibdelosporangium phytohabitans]